MNIEKLRLQKILFECNKHIEKLNTAYGKLHTLFPLTETIYTAFDEVQTSYLDQYLYRF